MRTGYHIRYLRRQDIDPAKWDACLDRAPNGLIYGRSFYLDQMAMRWDGLVLNDYEAVMPLPWNKKWGFYYCYQPYFCTALGVFGEEPRALPVTAFLEAIPKKFKYWDFALNEFNFWQPQPPSPGNPSGTSLPPALHWTPRINYFLDLGRSYEEMAAGYKRLATRMLKKAADHNLEVIRHTGAGELIGHYKKAYPGLGIPGPIYHRLDKCMQLASERGNTSTYMARTPDGEIVAFYLLLADNKFVYSLLGGSTPKGKEMAAFYLLTDAAIRDHATRPLTPSPAIPDPSIAGRPATPIDPHPPITGHRIFRFEGSDVPGIAFFDAQFGGDLTHYPYLLANQLPWPLKYAKPSRFQTPTR